MTIRTITISTLLLALLCGGTFMMVSNTSAGSNCGEGAVTDPDTGVRTLTCTESDELHALTCEHPSKPSKLILSVNGLVDEVFPCPNQDGPPLVDLRINLSDNPPPMRAPASYNVSWSTQFDPTSCVATGAWSGDKDVDGGSEQESDIEEGTYEYVIVCSNEFGHATDTVSINIQPSNCPSGSVWNGLECVPGPIGDIEADPDNVFINETSVVSWTSDNTDYCEVREAGSLWQTGDTESTGVTTGALAETTEYLLSCRGYDDVMYDLDTDTVDVFTGPELTADPLVIREGGTTELFWNTRNGNESICTLKQGIPFPDLIPVTEGDPNTGSIEIELNSDATFTLTCPVGEGTESASVNIRVIPQGFET